MTYTVIYGFWKLVVSFISISTLFGFVPAVVFTSAPFVEGIVVALRTYFKKNS